MGLDNTNLNLNFMTWNATGIMSSSSYLSDALHDHSIDFCGISEHWLYHKDLHFLDKINNNYISYGTADKDLLLPVYRKVGKGGVALLWNRKFHKYITTLDINSDRIIGIQFKYSQNCYMYLLQVYMPSRNHALDVYRNMIEELDNILSMYMDKGTVIIMGDMNAQISPRAQSGRIESRDRCLIDFLNDNNLVSACTLDVHKGTNATFVSFDGKSESHIDHIIMPYDKCDLLLNYNIPLDCSLNVSNHRPVICSITFPNTVPQSVTYEPDVLNWSKVKHESICMYTQTLQSDSGLIAANEQEIRTISDIDTLYGQLVNRLNLVTKVYIPKSKFKPHLKPYWTKELSEAHKLMKYLRYVWLQNGRPRDSDETSYKEYKHAKCEFRKLHRKAVAMYLKELDEQINAAAEIDSKQFWRLIKSKRSKSTTSMSAEIKFDGVTYRDPQEINKQWGNYFKNLYTPDEDESFDDNAKLQVANELREIKQHLQVEHDTVKVERHLITEAIKCSKRGKACGEDRVYYENFIYGGLIVQDILLKLKIEFLIQIFIIMSIPCFNRDKSNMSSAYEGNPHCSPYIIKQ